MSRATPNPTSAPICRLVIRVAPPLGGTIRRGDRDVNPVFRVVIYAARRAPSRPRPAVLSDDPAAVGNFHGGQATLPLPPPRAPLPLPSRPHLRTPDPRWGRRHSELFAQSGGPPAGYHQPGVHENQVSTKSRAVQWDNDLLFPQRTKEIRNFVCGSIGILPMRKMSNAREKCEV